MDNDYLKSQKEVLYFFRLHTQYIEQFLAHRIPLSYFGHETLRKMAGIMIDYHAKYHAVIAGNEWLRLLDALYAEKLIEEDDYSAILSIADDLEDTCKFNLTPDQFNRVMLDFIDYASTLLVEDIIKKHLHLRKNSKAIAFMDALISDFSRIVRWDDTPIEILPPDETPPVHVANPWDDAEEPAPIEFDIPPADPEPEPAPADDWDFDSLFESGEGTR
jgi:uncharacterized protein YciU (UPF0263 family)